MSKHDDDYRYDVEAELDESLGMGPRAWPLEIAKTEWPPVGTRITTDQILQEELARRERVTSRLKGLGDLFGTRIFRWEVSLPQGVPVVGEIAVPEDEGHSDLVMTAVFNKLFPSVEVRPIRDREFQVTIAGRVLGRIRLPGMDPYLEELVQRQVDTVNRGAKEQAMEREAMGWLRTNLILKVEGTDRHHPPYEPRIPKNSRVHVGTKPWIEFGSSPDSPVETPDTDLWRPVDEGAQNMAEGGVNLSSPGGTGVTNMARPSHQMRQTAISGERVDKMRSSGRMLRMHVEGTVIG